MKKKLLAFVVLSLFSAGAVAQETGLENAVGFTKPVEKEVVAQSSAEEKKEERKIGAVPKTDVGKMLAEKTKHLSIIDNPRFAKKAYAGLRGRQRSIEQLQQKKVEESSYPNEKAKEEALEQIKGQALVRFEDYQEDAEEVKKKIGDNPRESVLDMASRLSYPTDTDKESIDRANAIREKLNQNFLDEHGVTQEEYMNAYKEQVRIEMQQRAEEQNKAESFPILTTDKDVAVEKLDEQNALLHVSVGAPKSKKE